MVSLLRNLAFVLLLAALGSAQVLTVPNGGTGQSSFPSNGVLLGNGFGGLSTVPLPAGGGYCLISTGTLSAPSWATCASGGGGGITSINGDITAAQHFIGSSGVTVSTVAGVTTISIAAALSSITLAPASVVGGGSSTGTVTLSSSAPTGGALVTLSSNNTPVAQVPASVTVAAGVATATFVATTSSVASNTTVTLSGTYSGTTKTAGLTVTPPPQPVYGGVGAPGATSSVTLSGTHVVLSTGDSLPQLQAAQEQVGQSWVFNPNNQVIYVLLVGGNHTFVDANGITFVFNAPIACNLNGVTMYLYQSTYQLFGQYTVKVAS